MWTPRRVPAPRAARVRGVRLLSLPDRLPEGAMRLGAVGAGLAAWVGAGLSSLCCLLPLAIITLGLGSGAFMAVTMQYRWILIPAGVLGVTAGFMLYVRERRRCDAGLPHGGQPRDAGSTGHRQPGRHGFHRARSLSRAHGRFPGPRHGSRCPELRTQRGRHAMSRWSAAPWFVFVLLVLIVSVAQAAATVTLSVEGMT